MAAKTTVQAREIDERLDQSNGIVERPKVAVPFTTILRRSLVTDFSKDLLPRLGVERIPTQQGAEVQGEAGPTGDRVFRALNDVHDQIRFVGTWTNSSGNDGPSVTSGTIGDFIEVVFYGTGINVMMTNIGTDRGFTVFIDGSSVATVVTTNSPILGARGYSPNVIFSCAQGLALGLHTARLVKTTAANSNVAGFEILNAATTLQLPAGASYAGGKRLYKSALTTDTYASNFESGTLATKGGRVLVYQKSDGTIGKALQATDASQLNLSATNHANEEMIRTYHFREFGVSRTAADDFSSVPLNTPSNRAFTLEDGTTTLVGNNIGSEFEAVSLFVNGTGYVQITFVGTGLDIQTTAEVAGSVSFDVSVNGTSIGTLTNTSTEKAVILPVVSGLPYGTHVVKILRTAASGSTPHIAKFITYGPKKPTLPAGAVELANYYIMANFAVGTITGVTSMSTGTLRKDMTREVSFVNGTGGSNWAASGVDPANCVGVNEFFSNHINSSVSYTFFGTGFVLRGRANTNRSANIAVTANGLALTTANFPGLTTSVAGFTSFSAGVLNQVGTDFPGAAFAASGLPLGVYTVRFNQAAAAGGNNNIQVGTIDVITPIHFPDSNLPGLLLNALPIGSMAIGDTRSFSDINTPSLQNWAQAIGVFSTPTQSTNTMTPMPDMTCVIKTTGRPVEINWTAEIETISSSTNSRVDTQFYVNGVAVGQPTINQFIVANQNIATTVSNTLILPLSAGVHVVQLWWNVSGTSAVARSSGTSRILTVKEL